jgi:hypothetical protein
VSPTEFEFQNLSHTLLFSKWKVYKYQGATWRKTQEFTQRINHTLLKQKSTKFQTLHKAS